jgi:hypothetical protein
MNHCIFAQWDLPCPTTPVAPYTPPPSLPANFFNNNNNSIFARVL